VLKSRYATLSDFSSVVFHEGAATRVKQGQEGAFNMNEVPFALKHDGLSPASLKRKLGNQPIVGVLKRS
jgi:hypothetical protein